jgi:hypothetical protein
MPSLDVQRSQTGGHDQRTYGALFSILLQIHLESRFVIFRRSAVQENGAFVED